MTKKKQPEKARCSFVFYTSWRDSLEGLPTETRCEVYEAIVDYAITGKDPEGLSPMAALSFRFIKPEMDKARESWEKNRENKKKAASARWGKEGNLHARASSALQYVDGDVNGDVDEDGSQTTSGGSYVRRGVLSAPAPVALTFPPEDVLGTFLAETNRITLESVAMRLRLSIDELGERAQALVDEWILARRMHKSYADAASHLIRHITNARNWELAQPQQKSITPKPSTHGTTQDSSTIDAEQRAILELALAKINGGSRSVTPSGN